MTCVRSVCQSYLSSMSGSDTFQSCDWKYNGTCNCLEQEGRSLREVAENNNYDNMINDITNVYSFTTKYCTKTIQPFTAQESVAKNYGKCNLLSLTRIPVHILYEHSLFTSTKWKRTMSISTTRDGKMTCKTSFQTTQQMYSYTTITSSLQPTAALSAIWPRRNKC